MNRGAQVIVALALLVPVTSAARADDSLDEAQRLNNQGIEAMEQRLDFVAARELFERSLAVHPTPAAGFNLGHAYHSQGSPLQAIAVWNRVLEGAYGELVPEQRAEVARMIDEASALVASIRVRLQTARAVARLSVDGEPEGELDLGDERVIPVDPGRHVVSASAEGYERVERVLRVGPGEREAISLTLTALPSGSVFESAWFWVVVGAVLAAGGAGLAIALAGPYYGAPEESPPFGSAITLLGP